MTLDLKTIDADVKDAITHLVTFGKYDAAAAVLELRKLAGKVDDEFHKLIPAKPAESTAPAESGAPADPTSGAGSASGA